MRYRTGFLLLLFLSLPFFVSPAHIEQKLPRVGLLRVDSPPRKSVDEFRRAMRDLGYVESQNLALDIRWAESKPERLSQLASELVQLKSDVIVTHGLQGVRAAKAATHTIPIVIGRIDDIDMHGFIKTLTRPGGNITGLSFQTGELTGKCLELIKEVLPKLTDVAVLWDATGNTAQRQVADEAGRALGVKLHLVDVHGTRDFDRAFEAAARSRAKALIVLGSPLLTFNVAPLAKLAAKHRLAAIYTNTNFADAGGLMAYGPDESDPNWGWKRAAVYVDKILKGA